MKKSQMERLVAGLLSTMYETDQHPEKQLSNAKHLVKCIEEWGMKPPVKKRDAILLREEHVWEKE